MMMSVMMTFRGVRLAKMTSVQFCKKNCSFRFGFGFTKLTAVSFFSVRLGLHSSADVDAIFHLRLYSRNDILPC